MTLIRGKPSTVMRGSLRNVVGLTRPYALPLTALFWAPNTRSVQHDQLGYLSFSKDWCTFVIWSVLSYTAQLLEQIASFL
jgi:hypothetical protein